MKSKFIMNNNKTFNHVDIGCDMPDDIYNVDDGPDGRVYTTDSREWSYPSVTTVLGDQADMSWLQGWYDRVGEETAKNITRNASERGTAFHDSAEKYLSNKPVTNKHGLAHKMFLEAKDNLDRIDDVMCLENALVSHKLRIAGRVDCIGSFDGAPSLIDFKTSRKVKTERQIESYRKQVALYAYMFEEMTGLVLDNYTIIMACETGEQLIFEGYNFNNIESAVNDVREYWKLREVEIDV